MLIRVFDVERNTDGIIVQRRGAGHFRKRKGQSPTGYQDVSIKEVK
jgi:hypothetical protein